jgi:tetratricopeptide (TPR) repeat protein
VNELAGALANSVRLPVSIWLSGDVWLLLQGVQISEEVRLVQAIETQASNASTYAARAQAYIKLEKWLLAIQDANKAVELNPKLAKAHQRRG